MYFAYFQKWSIKISPNCENYMKPVGACGNYISKCPDISENMSPILVHTILLNRSYQKMFLHQSLSITLYNLFEHSEYQNVIFSGERRHLCFIIGCLLSHKLYKIQCLIETLYIARLHNLNHIAGSTRTFTTDTAQNCILIIEIIARKSYKKNQFG